MSDQVARLAHALRVKDVLVRHAAVVAVGTDQLVVVGADGALRIADERMYRAKREASV